MKKALMIVAAAAMALAPLTSSAAIIRGGFVFGGPAFYAPAPYWASYWGPYPYYAYPSAGQVKIDTKVKDAQVFINGAYAGLTKDNKTMHLRPGSYTIEVRQGQVEALNQQVFVSAGKTIHITPAL